MKKIIYCIFLLFITMIWAQEKPNIALLDLEGSGISEQDLQSLTNRLQTEIFKTDRFTMLERSKINEVLEEQQFQMTGCTDLACAIEIGRLLNVEYIVVGNVDKVSTIYSVNIRLVDVTTGEIIKNEIDDCSGCTLDQVFLRTLKNAAHKIAGIEIETPSPQPGVTPQQQPANVPVNPPPQTTQNKPRKKSRFHMTYYVGIGTSGSLKQEDPDYFTLKHVSSFNFGMGYYIPLTKHFYFQPEIVFSNRKAELNPSFFYQEKYSNFIYHMHIPLLLSYHMSSFSTVFLGPSFGFFLGGNYDSEYGGDDYDKKDFNSPLNRFIFGAEIRLGPLCLGYRYTNDLNEEDKNLGKIKRKIEYFTVGLILRP